MKLTEESKGTAEQLEACAAARAAMLEFMVKRNLVGVIIGTHLGQQWTTAGINLADRETVFVNTPEGKITIDPTMAKLVARINAQADKGYMLADDELIGALIGMARRTGSTLIGVQELRTALVAQLDIVIDIEHQLKGMLRTLPASVIHLLAEEGE